MEWEGMQLRRRDIAALVSKRPPPGHGRAGGGAVIPRYSPPDMAALFKDAWRSIRHVAPEVELLAYRSCRPPWAIVPAGEAATCRAKAPTVDDLFVADVLEREKVTDHDVAAFVDVVQERIGAPAGSHIHYGLTSSDVVDTALCATLTRAADLLLADLDAFVRVLKARALELLHVPVTGRTHGMHAEPTTFGAKFALWALQADGDQPPHAGRPATGSPWGKLSGAVGAYSNIDPEVEASVCAALGFDPGAGDPGGLLRPPRGVLLRCAQRPWARPRRAHVHRDPAPRPGAVSSARRWEEPFAAGQEGQAPPCRSSGIPSSPSDSCGQIASSAATLKRRARGRGACGCTNATSRTAQVRRAGGPSADASLLAWYVLPAQSDWPGRGPRHPPRTGTGRTLTEGTLGLVFSQSVLLALVSAGLTHDDALPASSSATPAPPGPSAALSVPSSRRTPTSR